VTRRAVLHEERFADRVEFGRGRLVGDVFVAVFDDDTIFVFDDGRRVRRAGVFSRRQGRVITRGVRAANEDRERSEYEEPHDAEQRRALEES